MAPPGVSALHDQCPLQSLVTEGIVSASSDAPGHCWWSSGERCGFLLHARSWWGRVEEGVEWNSCAESWIVDPKIETRDCCGGVLAKRTSHFQINCDCAETEKKDNAFYGLATNRRKITKISATSITTWSVSVGHLSLIRFRYFVAQKTLNNAVKPQSSIVLIVPVNNKHHEAIELYRVTALFGIFIETNKYQNLMRPRLAKMI